MKFACFACSQKIEAPAELAGRTIPCPECGVSLQVPAAASAPPPPPLPAPVFVAVPTPPPGAARPDRVWHKPRGALASMFLGRRYFCRSCHGLVSGRLVNAGSGAVELVCWLLLCAPGLIYSVWRRTCGHRQCDRCGHPTLIPENSPAALDHLSR